MKWHNFEDKIKQEISAQRADIDIDGLWADMEEAVDAINDKKKKRRGFFWFFAAGILVCSGLAAAHFGWNTTMDITKEKTNISDYPILSQPESEVNLIVETNNLYANKTTLNTPSSRSSSRVVTNQALTNSEPTLKSDTARKLPASQDLDETRSPKQSSSNLRIAADNQLSGSPLIEEKPIPIPAVQPNFEKLTSINAIKKIPYPTIHLLSQEVKADYFDRPQNSNFLSVIAPPAILEETRQSPFDFSIGVQAGLSFTDRKLSAKSEEFSSLIPLRNRTEQHLETINTSLDLILEHESGFSLSTGIQFTQINERYRYKESVILSDSIFGIERFIRQPNGSLDTIYGLIPNDIVRTFNKEYFNKFRMIDIPIIAGFQKEMGVVRVGVQAGVLVNISMDTEGRVLDSATTDTDVTESGIYRSNVGLSYHFGLSVGHTLNNGIEIYAAPFARIFPKSFTASSYGLDQKYRLYGLNLGARWRF